MSISALGATSSSSAATYDFTNVTNGQFLEEVQSLAKQGALSPTQQAMLTLTADGGDSVPISGPRPSTAQVLSSPTTRNFIDMLQTLDDSEHRTPGSVGAALTDSLLQTLRAYQGKAMPSTSGSTTA
jgi:hypothetical protein